MTIDYTTTCKLEVDLAEDYETESGHPKYYNDTEIVYTVKDVEIGESKVKLDVERKYIDITPFEFENPMGEASEVKQHFITNHKLTIDKRDFDRALQAGDYIKATIEQSSIYNQKMISAETVSGPKVSDGDLAEIFIVLDEMMEGETILLLVRKQ